MTSCDDLSCCTTCTHSGEHHDADQTWITGDLAVDIQTYHKIVTDGGPQSYSEWTAPELAEQVADRLSSILDAANSQHEHPATLTPEHESAELAALTEDVGDVVFDYLDRLGLNSAITRPYALAEAVVRPLASRILDRDAVVNDLKRVSGQRDVLLAELDRVREERDDARETSVWLLDKLRAEAHEIRVERDLLTAEVAQLREELAGAREVPLVCTTCEHPQDAHAVDGCHAYYMSNDCECTVPYPSTEAGA